MTSYLASDLDQHLKLQVNRSFKEGIPGSKPARTRRQSTIRNIRHTLTRSLSIGPLSSLGSPARRASAEQLANPPPQTNAAEEGEGLPDASGGTGSFRRTLRKSKSMSMSTSKSSRLISDNGGPKAA
eukprot:6841706-Pyramimonas_sp.AAC.2